MEPSPAGTAALIRTASSELLSPTHLRGTRRRNSWKRLTLAPLQHHGSPQVPDDRVRQARPSPASANRMLRHARVRAADLHDIEGAPGGESVNSRVAEVDGATSIASDGFSDSEGVQESKASASSDANSTEHSADSDAPRSPPPAVLAEHGEHGRAESSRDEVDRSPSVAPDAPVTVRQRAMADLTRVVQSLSHGPDTGVRFASVVLDLAVDPRAAPFARLLLPAAVNGGVLDAIAATFMQETSQRRQKIVSAAVRIILDQQDSASIACPSPPGVACQSPQEISSPTMIIAAAASILGILCQYRAAFWASFPPCSARDGHTVTATSDVDRDAPRTGVTSPTQVVLHLWDTCQRHSATRTPASLYGSVLKAAATLTVSLPVSTMPKELRALVSDPAFVEALCVCTAVPASAVALLAVVVSQAGVKTSQSGAAAAVVSKIMGMWTKATPQRTCDVFRAVRAVVLQQRAEAASDAESCSVGQDAPASLEQLVGADALDAAQAPDLQVRLACADLVALVLSLSKEQHQQLRRVFGAIEGPEAHADAEPSPGGTANQARGIDYGELRDAQTAGFFSGVSGQRLENTLFSGQRRESWRQRDVTWTTTTEDFIEAAASLVTTSAGAGAPASAAAMPRHIAEGDSNDAEAVISGLVPTKTTMQNLEAVLNAADACASVLLQGPTGSGKTATVAEAAKRRGATLLRVNVSSKVLSAALHCTRSHGC